LGWEQDNSSTSDSEEELENWQNRLHEVSTRQCEKMTKAVHSMTIEVCDFPFYDGLGTINNFLEEYKEHVTKCQRLLALNLALRATPARWWGTHKKNIGTWQEC